MIDFPNRLLNWITAASESSLGIFLSVLLLAGLVILIQVKAVRRQSKCISAGDLAAVGFAIVQLLTYFSSVSRPNTVHYLAPYAIALCLYTSIRLLSRWPVATAKLFSRVLVGFGFLLVITNFPLQLSSIQSATRIFSQSELISIRAALPLAGAHTKNDLVAVLLSILPVALAGASAKRTPNRYFWIVCIVVASGLSALLVLSFSRSGYLTLGLLFISFVILTASNKTASRVRSYSVLVCVSAVVFAAAAYVNAESTILMTFRGEGAISQVRSSAGRLDIWRESAYEVMEHPFVGYGGGNGGIIALNRLSHSDLPFVSRTYNGPLEILLLSGMGGLALYAIFLIQPLLAIRRARWNAHLMRPYPALLAVGLIALIAHDLTYASLVTNGVTIIIAWGIAASLQNTVPHTLIQRQYADRRISQVHLAYVAIGASCVVLALSLRLEQAEKHYIAGSSSLAKGDAREARAEFQQAIRLEPRVSMFYAADGFVAAEEAMGIFLPSRLWSIVPTSTRTNDQLLAIAEQDYKTSVSLVEEDASYWSDLAWVEVFRDENDLALRSFVRAVQIDPNDSVARVDLGLFYERRKLKTEAIQQYAYAIAVSPRILDSEFFADLRTRSPESATMAVLYACDLVKTFPLSPIHRAAEAKLHAFLGETDLAYSEYSQTLHQLPNLSYASANLGVLDMQLGDTGSARIELERARFLDGTNRFATNMLALIERQDGNLDSAKRLYQETLLMPDISVHAQRSWRLYQLPTPIPDDLLPQGLLSYLSPDIRQVGICDASWLAELFRAHGNMPSLSRKIVAQEMLCIGAGKPVKVNP